MTTCTRVTDRIASLRAALQRHGLSAWIVASSDPHLSEYLPPRWQGRQWLSGFTGSVGTLVVTARFAGLWVDSRYWLQADAELDGTGIAVTGALSTAFGCPFEGEQANARVMEFVQRYVDLGVGTVTLAASPQTWTVPPAVAGGLMVPAGLMVMSVSACGVQPATSSLMHSFTLKVHEPLHAFMSARTGLDADSSAWVTPSTSAPT